MTALHGDRPAVMRTSDPDDLRTLVGGLRLPKQQRVMVVGV